jgi:hypothetical protein
MISRVRVWLNRTYAENVFFMDQLRRNPQDRAVEIHATHGDPDSPVLAAADTAAMEPEGLSPAAYVEFALDQCARRGIDVFVPRLHQEAIVAHRAEFEAVGTALLAPTAEGVAAFQDKAPTSGSPRWGSRCRRGSGCAVRTNWSRRWRSWRPTGTGPASSPPPERAAWGSGR